MYSFALLVIFLRENRFSLNLIETISLFWYARVTSFVHRFKIFFSLATTTSALARVRADSLWKSDAYRIPQKPSERFSFIKLTTSVKTGRMP